MTFRANFGSGKEQYGDSGDGEKSSEDRLPADFFLKDEVADRKKDKGRQRHQGASVAKPNLAVSPAELTCRLLSESNIREGLGGCCGHGAMTTSQSG